jgi:hypothetical protein
LGELSGVGGEQHNEKVYVIKKCRTNNIDNFVILVIGSEQFLL